MSTFHRFAGGLLSACAAAILLQVPASAQDRDTQEVMAYTLTDAGLAKYTQAMKNLAALPEGIPGACDDDESDSQTINQSAAKLNSVPVAKAAIQSAGMTTREYIVFSWSILQNGLAAWAVSQPGGKLPAGASKANVDFYNKNAAKLKSLAGLQKNSDCEDERDENEE